MRFRCDWFHSCVTTRGRRAQTGHMTAKNRTPINTTVAQTMTSRAVFTVANSSDIPNAVTVEDPASGASNSHKWSSAADDCARPNADSAKFAAGTINGLETAIHRASSKNNTVSSQTCAILADVLSK